MNEKLEWYLPDPKGIAPVGPFSTEEISKMLEHHSLKIDDFTCCPSIKGESWHRIYEFEQFSKFLCSRPICPPPKTFSKGIYEEKGKSSRSYLVNSKTLGPSQRVVLDAEVIIHNNIETYIGKVNQIGLNGVEVRFDKEFDVNARDEYMITIFNSDLLKTFTARGAILDIKNVGGSLILEMYFLRINPSNKRDIYGLVDRETIANV